MADGSTVVPLALGVMNMATVTPEAESRKMLDHFVGEVVPRFAAADGSPARAMVDTADCYCWWNDRGSEGGHSEAALGRWFAETATRERVYLATKGTARVANVDQAWDADGNPDWVYAQRHYLGSSRAALEESLPASLERLGVASVDLYYVHVDDRRTPLEETLETLAGFAADGRIGQYGWSNVPAWRLAEIGQLCRAHGWPTPAAVQEEHSYLRPKASKAWNGIVGLEHLDYLRETPSLALVAYSPILKGIYDEGDRRDRAWMEDRYSGPDVEARLAAVRRAAKKLGATPNQTVLAWMMAREAPRTVPLVGPRTYDQYTQLVEALDVELTPDQVAELDAAGD
jgi:aryl-alcohol dehydrogenase-like predicted oxidoreductase